MSDMDLTERLRRHENSRSINEQLKVWLEIILTIHYRKEHARNKLTKLILDLETLRKPTAPEFLRRLGNTPGPSRQPEPETTPTTDTKMEPNEYTVHVESLEFTNSNIVESDALHARVQYKIGTCNRHRLGLFIIKVSKVPSRITDQESLDDLLGRSKREVDFYTRGLPSMQEKLKQCGIYNESLGAAECIYGQYMLEDVVQVQHVQDSAAKDIEDAFGIKVPPKQQISVLRNETHSILILQDLAAEQFRREYGNLSVHQIQAFLRQIAILHATAYAIKMDVKKDLPEHWSFVVQPQEVLHYCSELVAKGFKTFLRFLRRWVENDEEAGVALVRKVKKIQPHVQQIISNLMLPGDFPATMINWECQGENVLFRQLGSAPLTEIDHYNNNSERQNIECVIANWGIASYGTPTHDIAFFLLSSVSRQQRTDSLADFLSYYFTEFKTICEKLRIPVSFTLEDIEEEYQKSLVLCTILSIGNFFEVKTFPDTGGIGITEAMYEIMESDILREYLETD